MSTASRDPTLAEVLDLTIRAKLANVWTSLPGIVERYDAAKQCANVRPAVDDRHELADGEELLELPVIPNVPVVQPGGGGFFVSFPLAKGDPVLLVFCTRSIDAWKSGDGSKPVDPQSFRMHDISDAYAIPGGRPFKAPLASASADDLVIGDDDGDALLTLKGDGLIIIGKGAAAEAARKGDAIQATIPAGTVIIAVSGGSGAPAVGTPNPTDIILDGEITAGSSNVKVG